MAKLTYTKEIEIELSPDDIGRYFQELNDYQQKAVFENYIIPDMTGWKTGLENAKTFVDNLSKKQQKELAEYINAL